MSDGQSVASKEQEAAILLIELILYIEHNCKNDIRLQREAPCRSRVPV